MNGHIAIAIDGPAGAGKSTLARRCASHFSFLYVDTGAIYRTLGLAALRRGVDRKDASAVTALLPQFDIQLRYNEQGEQRMYLDGEDVSAEIRRPEISICASDVSAHADVRRYLLEMQRRLARENDVIMDGRDIGTVVLPDAEVKIFLTASAEARARRRMRDLEQKGITQDFASILADIRYRDEQDSARAAAPLRAAEDAVLVDTTDADLDQSEEMLLAVCREKLGL